jgi:Fe-Mn family superoxide dismutase
MIMKTDRRKFIKSASVLGFVGAFTDIKATGVFADFSTHLSSPEEISYLQQPLPYAYTTLEPSIDALTMEIHYTKHAAGYTKNLSDACAAEKVNTAALPLTSLLATISSYSVKMRNNAGGHYNHEFFWKSLFAPKSDNAPMGELSSALQTHFGSIDNFKSQFEEAARNRFGSGWAWLVKTSDGKLKVCSTPNQDNPLMDVSECKGVPLLGLDVWEHAYYLKYQNRRPDYIKAWWPLINWDVIEQRYKKA